METTFKLSQTTDYSLFKVAKNRSVNPKDVAQKRKSIAQIGLQSPIIVNRRYEIVDGQHRFHALRELNLPVDYLVSYNWKEEENTATINNTQKSWNTENWAEFRACQGNNEIARALELARNYNRLTNGKMSVTSALEMMSCTSSTVSGPIKNGTYCCDNEFGNEIYQLLTIVSEYPSSLKNAYSQKMVRAMKMLKNDLGYINRKAIHRMASRNMITTYNNESDMFRYIKKIYNQSLKK